MSKDPFISFVIPTIGRDTLGRTLESCKNQIIDDWEAIVMVDQHATSPYVYDGIYKNKVRVYDTGAPHHESVCRNMAIQEHVRGEWVGFIDDDDTIAPEYIWCLKEMIKKFRSVDLVIFKQTTPINRQAPEHTSVIVIPNEPEIVWGNVGISYAVRTNVAKEFPFKQSKHEDLLQLVAIEAAGFNIMWCPEIMYFGMDRRVDD